MIVNATGKRSILERIKRPHVLKAECQQSGQSFHTSTSASTQEVTAPGSGAAAISSGVTVTTSSNAFAPAS